MTESIKYVRTKAVACLTLILPQVIGLHWDNTAASDFLNTAASDWIILPPVMGHPPVISLTSRGLPKAGEPSLISQLSMARHAEHGHQEGSPFACGSIRSQSLVAVKTSIFYCRKWFFFTAASDCCFLRGRGSILKAQSLVAVNTRCSLNRLWRY